MKKNALSLIVLFLLTMFSLGAERPNVVIFLVDDPGSVDFGFQGTQRVKTPNIDRLAHSGVIFTNGYTTGCVCSPTRAGLNTGRYQQRFGFDANAEGGGNEEQRKIRTLDIAQTTTAQRFKSLGYTTAAYGKWHLGSVTPEYLPTQRGYDEFVGVLPFGIAAKEPDGSPTKFYKGRSNVHAEGQSWAVIERPENPMEEYERNAVTFIEKNKSKPFFLYLPFTHVHGPHVGTKKYLETLDEEIPLNEKKYLADLLETDAVIGRIVKKIQDAGLEENTLIFFLGDNGGPGGAANNGQLRGTKWFLWEGGIRVPFAVSWKGHIQGGRILNQPVISLDIIRTALEVAGAKVEESWKLDGSDLLPLLQGKTNNAPHDALFWRFGSQYAVRKGDWKLIKPHIDKEPQLYHLAKDVSETTDLAKQEPEKYKELLDTYNAWNVQNEPERWHDPRSEGNGTRNAATKNIKPDTKPGVKLKFDFRQNKNKITETSGQENKFSIEGKLPATEQADGFVRYFDGTAYIQLEKSSVLHVAQTPWSVEAVIATVQPDGIILAHGGINRGYTLYLENGLPAFGVRTNREFYAAAGQNPINHSSENFVILKGVITPDKKAELYVNQQKVASVNLPDFITDNPAETLQIGTDLGSLVGEKPLPPFHGWIQRIEIRREPLTLENK
jgi:arylsulfatase A-like enzyme